MAYPVDLYNPLVDDVSAATLRATNLNDATYSHVTVHRNDAAELVAIETYIGTNASQTTPVGANRVLASTSASASTWTASPTLTNLTLGGTLAVTGAGTFSSTVALNGIPTVANNIALTFAANAGTASTILQNTSNNIVITVGTAGSTIDLARSTGAVVAVLDTTNTYFGARAGYQLRAYGSGNSNALSLYHDNTNAFVATNAGTLNLQDSGGTNSISIATTGTVITGRLTTAQGANVASAATITLGNGNFFSITGTTSIDNIVATNWQAGSKIALKFNDNITINHNTAGSGARLFLSGSANFGATANDTLTLVYDGTQWLELARTVI